MTKIACVLWLTRSRKLVHVAAVEIISDGPAELRYSHAAALCGVLVRSEPRDLDLSRATCPRCAARAASLVAQ